MKITYLGHSGFLIETAQASIVIDPFLKGNDTAKAKPEDIKCDYIIVTHAHFDHLGDSVEIAKKNDATIISTWELCSHLSKENVKVHPMHLGGGCNFSFGRVKLTIAFHGSSIMENGNVVTLGSPAGIILTVDDKTIYHSGDTALFSDMKLIGDHGIDLALLPIGDNFTMGIDDAVKAVEFIKPKLVAPIHYGTFDAIKVDPNEFKTKVEAKGFKAKVMTIGETFDL